MRCETLAGGFTFFKIPKRHEAWSFCNGCDAVLLCVDGDERECSEGECTEG